MQEEDLSINEMQARQFTFLLSAAKDVAGSVLVPHIFTLFCLFLERANLGMLEKPLRQIGYCQRS